MFYITLVLCGVYLLRTQYLLLEKARALVIQRATGRCHTHLRLTRLWTLTHKVLITFLLVTIRVHKFFIDGNDTVSVGTLCYYTCMNSVYVHSDYGKYCGASLHYFSNRWEKYFSIV